MAQQKPYSKMQISEVLQHVQMQKKIEDRVKVLQNASEHNKQLKRLLKASYDASVKWLLPEGDVPYNATTDAASQRLENVVQKIHYMVEGGYPNLKQSRRESLFIQFLESLDQHNAEILQHAKDQKLHELYSALTPKVVEQAFPNLLQEPIKDSRKSQSKGKPGRPKKSETKDTNRGGSQETAPTVETTEADQDTGYVDPAFEKADPNPTED